MELGDIWLKVARNQALTPQEEEFFRLSGKQVQINNAYISGLQEGSSDINARSVRALNGYFDTPPFGQSVRVRVDNPITISNNTGTDVTFETKYYDDNDIWSPNDPTNLRIKTTGKYQIVIRMKWSINGTGFRSASLTNGVSNAIVGIFPPHASTSEYLSLVDEVNMYAGTSYRLRVYQNSGGDLDLDFVRCTLRLIRGSDDET